ncbi:hypothetical protein C0991_000306 [Blastosporella zonata]|nr:hypothetical protein C0991_000306 [Blastosporella zonata]
MEVDHDEGHWEEHHPPGGPLEPTPSGRSSRPRKDSHSRRHHRERESGRGSTKSKNPGHRSTRYKDKFHLLRDKYDRTLALRDTIERELFAAAEKMDKIQAENDLLLDAIYTAAPELMQLVSPVLSARPIPSPQPPPPPPHPHQQGPLLYQPPPRALLGISPRPTHSPSLVHSNSNHNNHNHEHEPDHEMGHVVRESPRHRPARMPSSSSVQTVTNGNPHTNGNGNGIIRIRGPEVCGMRAVV